MQVFLLDEVLLCCMTLLYCRAFGVQTQRCLLCCRLRVTVPIAWFIAYSKVKKIICAYTLACPLYAIRLCSCWNQRLCRQTYHKVMLKYNYSHLTPFDTRIHFVRYESSYRSIRALTPNDTRQQSSLFEITFNVFWSNNQITLTLWLLLKNVNTSLSTPQCGLDDWLTQWLYTKTASFGVYPIDGSW